MKGFLTKHGSGGIVPHLMRSGGTTHIMATWRVLTGRVNAPFCVTLGFLAEFHFFVHSF